MARYIWLFAIIGFVLLILGFLVYSLFNDLNNEAKSPLNQEKINKNPDKEENKINPQEINETTVASPSASIASSSSGGNAGGGSSGESFNENKEENSSSFCSLVRPGNIPNIKCSVNYLRQNEISIKLSDYSGQDINVKLSLQSCSIEEGLVKNNEEKNFVFSCNLQGDYFEGDLKVDYLIGEEYVESSGIIGGNVN